MRRRTQPWRTSFTGRRPEPHRRCGNGRRLDNSREHLRLTADVSLSFIAAGRAQALTADARIVRQGGSLTFLEVTVTNEDSEVVAEALVTCKLSKVRKS